MAIVNTNHENRSNFSDGINDALQHCQHAHNLLSTIRNEVDEIPTSTRSSLRNYCSIGLHVNNALQGSIRSIGYGGNMVNRLRTMLSTEQRGELADDLHGMQNEMVRTYSECQSADNELWQSLRQAVEEDPLLRDDVLAIQCVDAIEEHQNHLQSLPLTAEALRERSNTIESMQSQLTLLEERVECVNPNSPLTKILKIFHKTFEAIAHLMKSVIKSLHQY